MRRSRAATQSSVALIRQAATIVRDRVNASLHRRDLGLVRSPIVLKPKFECSSLVRERSQLGIATGDFPAPAPLRQSLARPERREALARCDSAWSRSSVRRRLSLAARVEASLNRCDFGLACLPVLFDPVLECSLVGLQHGQLGFAVRDLLRQPLAGNFSLVQPGAKSRAAREPGLVLRSGGDYSPPKIPRLVRRA